MRTSFTALSLLLAVTLAGPPAAADTLTATLRQPLKEVAHRVDVRLTDGLATFRVRRTFANQGAKHEEASLRINLPYGAAATGLRIRGKRQWFTGELMEATKAAALYRKLTGRGIHQPKDPAILYWVWSNEVHLQVFPVPPKGRSTVEYTLTVPTSYQDGRYTLSYPRHNGAKNLAVPVLRIHPGGKGRRITVNGRATARSQSVALGQAVARPLPGRLIRKNDASYTVSALRIRRRGQVSEVDVAVDIRHTYKGDLKVRLVTPTGRTYTLHNQSGGSKNHVRKTYAVKLGERTPLAGRWHLVVSDHARMDAGRLVAWSVAGKVGKRRFRHRAWGLPKVVADAPAASGDLSQATLRIAPPRINTVAARLGRVVATAKKQFLRLELDAAPQLRPLPKNLSVVFVVDGSHTMGPDGIKDQLALARAYLKHVPSAHFEVVVYRRYAKRLVGRFAGAKTVASRIAWAQRKGRLNPGNGSALDRGLALAARLLRKRRGTRRVVFLSDDLLRPGWSKWHARRALARLPRGTVVHAVLPALEPGLGTVTEERVDNHRLARVAARTGGILLKIEGSDEFKGLVPVVLGLVRPIRIDHLKVWGLRKNASFQLPNTLKEGAGVREMAQLKYAPRGLVITGQIWAKRYRKVVRTTKRFTRATAAFIFSHDQHKELSRKEMMRVAKLGRVVSPVTSYLAIEPGVRPSTAGIERGGGGGFGLGGRGFGVGRLKVRAPRTPPDLRSLMDPYVRRCLARRKPVPKGSVKLRVHTTRDEVVDVIGRSRATPLRKCLLEGAWKVRLDSTFYKVRDTFDLALP